MEHLRSAAAEMLSRMTPELCEQIKRDQSLLELHVQCLRLLVQSAFRAMDISSDMDIQLHLIECAEKVLERLAQ